MWHRSRHMACSEMSQRYNHIAGGNGISLHNLLFNLALTHRVLQGRTFGTQSWEPFPTPCTTA